VEGTYYPGLGYFLGNSIVAIGIIAVIIGALIKLCKYINRSRKKLKIVQETPGIKTDNEKK
jgi:uncharacterized membrane protein (DUF106 family)